MPFDFVSKRGQNAATIVALLSASQAGHSTIANALMGEPRRRNVAVQVE